MAYTKYSLTPANNNAAPPDGAPEGMLPSAVNDTMRDMMAQIRDCGDGIRGGTYTMTAPVITGGSISGASVSATSLTDSGNLAFTGTGNRITGDFSNATIANRVAFQTSTTNGNTAVQTIPNGTSQIAVFNLENSSSPANNSFTQIGVDSSVSNISSGIRGTGTYLPLTFSTGGSERLRIDTSGNVGIGTNSPVTGLSVNKTSGYVQLTDGTIDYRSFVWSGNSAAAIGTWSNHALLFNTNNAERMRITSGGNVLIGTTNDGYRLNVASNDTTANIGYAVRILCNTTAGAGAIQWTDNPVTAEYAWLGVDSSKNMKFATNGTERMRIDSSGNLLVGCTAVPNVGVSGQYGTSSSDSEVVISKNTSGTTPALYIRTSSGASKTPIAFYNDASAVGSITTSTTATAYNTSSDYRLKENIAPMQGALDVVQQLKPVTYTWKADGSEGQGFIAHELQAVVPDCVTGEKDAVDAEGKPVYQGIDTSFLVATLTAAIKEQQVMIEELKAKVAALEAK